MPCAEALRVQAFFDGEVDAVSAAEIEAHAGRCAECQAWLQDLQQLRTALREELTFARTPPALRTRITAALDRESAVRALPTQPRATLWRKRSFWAGAWSGMAAAAVAAGLAFFALAPVPTDPIVDDIMSAHLRSLMPAHLIDVVSTDKHTVKPWFAGHADVSPAVADFETQGYKLVGGRADYFDHQRAAAVVYQHGAHVINVFSWAAERRALPKNMDRNGYHLVFWQVGNMAYCAVSDADRDEVLGLAKLLRSLGADDNPQ